MEEILRQKAEGPDMLGVHPETGEPILVLTGQYGPYVQLGEVVDDTPKPKRASLPKGIKPDQVTCSRRSACWRCPDCSDSTPTGANVHGGLGRFGPYVVHDQGREGISLAQGRGPRPHGHAGPRARAARPTQAGPGPPRGAGADQELGPHPADKKPIGLYDGQYGPYVKHGDVSASLPRGSDPGVFTAPEAIELLAAKRASGPRKAGRRFRKAASK